MPLITRHFEVVVTCRQVAEDKKRKDPLMTWEQIEEMSEVVTTHAIDSYPSFRTEAHVTLWLLGG